MTGCACRAVPREPARAGFRGDETQHVCHARSGVLLSVGRSGENATRERALRANAAFCRSIGAAVTAPARFSAASPYTSAAAATSAITRESWLPCQAIGERPGSSVIKRAPGMASA